MAALAANGVHDAFPARFVDGGGDLFEFLFCHDTVTRGNADLFTALATRDAGIAHHSFFRARFAGQANVFALHDKSGFCYLFDVGNDAADLFEFSATAFRAATRKPPCDTGDRCTENQGGYQNTNSRDSHDSHSGKREISEGPLVTHGKNVSTTAGRGFVEPLGIKKCVDVVKHHSRPRGVVPVHPDRQVG